MPFIFKIWGKLSLFICLGIFAPIVFFVLLFPIWFVNRKKARYAGWLFLRQLIHLYLFVNNIKVNTIGEENIPANKVCVFMSNHQDQLDILLLYGFVNQPMGMVAKKEIGYLPVIGWWMLIMDCYLLDRKSPKQALNLFEKASKNIQSGYPALIYPEGTRSRGPKNGPFISGSMRLATMSKAPIVPITLSGSWKPLNGNPLGWTHCTIDITIGKPLETASFGRDKEALALAVQKAVEENFTDNNNETEKIKAYKAKYR